MSRENLSPACSACGRPATMIKLFREKRGVCFQYKGICAGNGSGDLISEARAGAIRTAFTAPYTAERIQLADLYDDGGFCSECTAFYCYDHWHVSTTGGGRCPNAHFKSLDPHWSPDEI